MIGHRPGSLGQVWFDESDRGRLEFAIVQTDYQFAVADDRVFVWPHVANLELDEPQRLVETQ